MKIKQVVLTKTIEEVEITDGKIYYNQSGIPVKLLKTIDGIGFVVNVSRPRIIVDNVRDTRLADGTWHDLKRFETENGDIYYFNPFGNHKLIKSLYDVDGNCLVDVSKYHAHIERDKTND